MDNRWNIPALVQLQVADAKSKNHSSLNSVTMSSVIKRQKVILDTDIGDDIDDTVCIPR